MATFAGIGFSQNIDARTAAQEAALQAKLQLNKDRIDLAIVFSTFPYDPKEFISVLSNQLDQTLVIGSSTAGIILPGRLEIRGIAVMAIYSDNIKFESGYVDHLHFQNLQEAGVILGKNSITDFGREHRKALILFIDGLLKQYSPFLDGINLSLGKFFPIFGSCSSDNFHCHKTFQFYKQQVLSDGACGILLGGQFKYAASIRHGFKPLGKPRLITNVDGPVIKEIDGKKAANIYHEFFDKEAITINTNRLGQINARYPLGIRQPEDPLYLLRNVISLLDDGSIVCQDNVAAGAEVHIMIGHKDTCLKAAQDAALETIERFENRLPSFGLVFSSINRHKIFGRTAHKEAELLQSAFGNIPFMGMYSLGEFFTPNHEGQTFHSLMHNNTITAIGIG